MRPNLEYRAQGDKARFSANYNGNFGQYASSSDDDYDDHTFDVALGLTPNDFFSVDFDASTARLHEDRGSLASEGSAGVSRTDPDEYDLTEYGVVFDFGRDSARFGLSLGFDSSDREYTNNETVTSFLDREETTVTAKLYSKISDRTQVFLQGIETDVEYDEIGPSGDNLDSDETALYIGAEWNITGKLMGEAKVGRLDKDFDSGFDDDLGVWFVSLTWSPREHSHFSIYSSQDAMEGNGSGLYNESTNHSITWIHNWSNRLQSEISVGTGSSDYANFPRKDDLDNYKFGLSYQWQRWLSVGLSFSHDERDSNLPQFDYDRDIAAIEFDLSL